MAEGGGLPSGPSIKIAGNKRPLLKDLHDHVLLEVADKWRDLGVQLLAPDHQGVLKVIAADHPRDVVSCCKCVLEKWLDTTTDATWDQLITALRSPSIQLDYLASQLEQMLITKCSPGKKAKSQLNELFQKHKINAKYDSTDDVTDGNVHNFTATLTYSVHGRKYQYESRGEFGRKQDAEEDTAQQALCEIEQQLKQSGGVRGVFGRKQDAEEDTAQQALCEIEQQLKQSGGVSYKQLLKERYCDERQLPTPQYTIESASGGFVSTVNVPQYKPVRGSVGNSKKEAEQLAAMEALRQLKII